MRQYKPILFERYPATDRSVHEIKEALRFVLTAPSTTRDGQLNAVIADRASGKTTALAELVAEKLLQLSPTDTVVVLFPSENVKRIFEDVFHESFPRLRLPLLVCPTPNSEKILALRGQSNIKGIYVEEMFMIPCRVVQEIEQRFPNIPLVGIGSIERAPVAVRISNW